ncbi:MAG: TIGR03013 family PEP-CTERM/XrtA system glycosyltransferase [Gammaproteobacteria bacterium]|nr:TIGR03013 family PEP-CTERM/XrtA system glycosyltransferase [Gammaproteobacteria bacterium]
MRTWSINRRARFPLLLMAAAELSIVFSSPFIASLLIFGNVDQIAPNQEYLGFKSLLLAIGVFLSLIAMGLYQSDQRLYFYESVVRIAAALVCATVGLAVIFFALPVVAVGKMVMAVAMGYSAILLVALRYFFYRTIDEHVFRRKILIYGSGKRASSIDDLRRKADRRGFKIVGRIAAPGDKPVESGTARIEHDAPLIEIAKKTGADEILVAMDERRGNLPIRQLLDARLAGVEVIDLLEFIERESGKIRVDLVSPGWLIFSSGFRVSRFRRFCQRTVDLSVSATLLLVAWPAMLLTMLAIKIEEGIRAPVIYRQSRVGEGGLPFSVLKFRSMRTDAEADGEARWATATDDRVTRVGAVLRKFRLDELPQVFNVLSGQMALVGPRPERPEFVDDLKQKIPYYAERHTIKPGVTGWAQVKYAYGASDEDAAEKLHYDLYYVKNQSLLLDIVIILQTVEVVLWGKGAR